MGITAFPFTAVIDVPAARILGRDDAGTGAAEALTNTEIFAILGTGTPSASTYLRGDGTWAAVSAGISSLNGLTDATQTFAVGTTGTNVAFSSAAGVHTLNIPDASATARGVVTTGAQTIAGTKTFSGDVSFTITTTYEIRGNQLRGGIHNASGFVTGTEFGGYKWTGGNMYTTPDLFLERDAAYRMGQRRSTNPQAFGVYNTYTSDTSFERLSLSWASNICYIGTEKGSAGGTARDLTLGTDGAVRLVLPAALTSGALHLGPRADNTATGGNARGANAVDLQTDRAAANQVASGERSFACGRHNIGSGAYSFIAGAEGRATGTFSSVIGGRYCEATNSHAVAGGEYCRATGVSSFAINSDSVASGSYSFASGSLSRANRFGMRAHSGGRFSVDGDCQLGELILRGITTTNAAVRLRPDGSTQRLTIASGQICQYLLIITGVRNGGADVASYMRQVTIKNIGGITSIVGTVNTIGVDNAAGTSLSVTADDTNDDLAVEPTGVFGQEWRWECVVYGGELRHG